MTDELLDLVDDKDEIVGEVWKSKANSDPKLIHREAAIAVFNKEGEVLLQQRALTKRNDPGVWKTTAAGHVGKGESPEAAIIREVKEELGIEIRPIFMYKSLETYKDLEIRFVYVYYSVLEKKQTLTLDKTEVMDAKRVKVEGLTKFSDTHDYSLKSGSHKMIIQAWSILKKH